MRDSSSKIIRILECAKRFLWNTQNVIRKIAHDSEKYINLSEIKSKHREKNEKE